MPKYFPGLNDALANVDTMTERECIRHMEALYGTDNLRYGASLEQLREECRDQIRRDFTDNSPEARADDAWIQAMGKMARESRQ